MDIQKDNDAYLLFVDRYPIGVGEVLMSFDIRHSVFHVTEPLSDVDL